VIDDSIGSAGPASKGERRLESDSAPAPTTPPPSKRRRQTNDVDAPPAKPRGGGGGDDNPLAVGLVAVLTESLRLLGVGRDRFAEAEAEAAEADEPRPPPGDVDAVARRIEADFARAYFVVGKLDAGVYDDDCRGLPGRQAVAAQPGAADPLFDRAADRPAAARGRGRRAAATAAVAAAASAARRGDVLGPLSRLLSGGGGDGGKGARASRVVRLGPVGPNGEEVLRARWYLETTPTPAPAPEPATPTSKRGGLTAQHQLPAPRFTTNLIQL